MLCSCPNFTVDSASIEVFLNATMNENGTPTTSISQTDDPTLIETKVSQDSTLLSSGNLSSPPSYLDFTPLDES